MALDPFELNPVVWQESFNAGYTASRYAGGGKPRRLGALWGLMRLSLRSMNAWRHPSGSPAFADGDVAWIVRTQNQRAALEPIAAAMGRSEAFEAVVGNSQISRYGLRVSVWFLPILIYRWFRASPRQRRSMRDGIEAYLATYGEYVAARRSFKRERPAVVVLSNDHVGFYNAVRLAAQHAGIPTVYVQHACVADHFPPLRFDWALLDGRDAAEKYLTRPTEAKVFLVGIAKLDDIASRTSCEGDAGDAAGRDRRFRIGVCFNALDDEDFIEQTLRTVREAFPEADVVGRLHPATRPTIVRRVQQLAETLSVNLSDSRGQSAIDFVATLSVMVCGASSIILEAAAAGVPSVAYFSEQATDVYGFVANGLCEHAADADALAPAIKLASRTTPSVLAARVAHYSDGFGQPDRPPSAEITAEIIRAIRDGRPYEGEAISISGHVVRRWKNPNIGQVLHPAGGPAPSAAKTRSR